MTIEYIFDLAVRNVQRLNVSRFVTGGAYVSTQILLKLIGIADFLYTGFCSLGSPKHLMISVYLFVFYFTIRPY